MDAERVPKLQFQFAPEGAFRQRSPNYSPRVDRSTRRSCTSLIAVPLSSPKLGEWGMLTIATLAGGDASLGADALSVAMDWANALVRELERHG